MSTVPEILRENTRVPFLYISILHDHATWSYERPVPVMPEGLRKYDCSWIIDPEGTRYLLPRAIWRRHSEFDVVGGDGRILRSGTISGDHSDELIDNFMVHARYFFDPSAELVTYPFGERPTSPCCVPVLSHGDAPDGGTWDAWSKHGQRIHGPDGWASRVYNADGDIIHETILERQPNFVLDLHLYASD